MENLYEICTNISDPIHATKDWIRKETGRIICLGCNSIDRSWYPRPIDVELRKRPSHRINDHIWFTGIEIFHIDFINQIRQHLSAFVIGRCYDNTGREIIDYVTCYTDKWIVVRAGEKSNYKICNLCGSISRGFAGSTYVLKDYLSDDHIFQDRNSCLYIDEETKNYLDLSLWSDALLDPIPVLEEPLDRQHLPCDPPHIVEKYPQNYWRYSVDKHIVEKIRREFGIENKKVLQ